MADVQGRTTCKAASPQALERQEPLSEGESAPMIDIDPGEGAVGIQECMCPQTGVDLARNPTVLILVAFIVIHIQWQD